MTTLAAATPLIDELISLLGGAAVISREETLSVYDSDGLMLTRAAPLAVVFPTTTQEVADVVRLVGRHGVAVVPRGAATGLAGGLVAVTPSVQVSTARMRKIHAVDLRNRWALVDAGVANLALSAAVADSPYHFSPDPSSQRASTIGGNVATNAGGVHTLKHGVTVNHLLGLEIVLADGSVHVLGGPAGHDAGPDLAGLICGTEGTLGIVTRVWCRLSPRPRAFRTALAVFDSTEAACKTVADTIAAGIVPAALEMMDSTMTRVVEEAFNLGLPKDAGAVLLVEIDGVEQGLDEAMERIGKIAHAHGARTFEAGADPKRRADLWKARKQAFGAIGRLGVAYCTQDACVPRSKLPEVIAEIGRIGARHGMMITNCFHAGDGNVHPILCYDGNDPAQVRRVLDASGEILRYCINVGGSVTGEHGVGIEKLPYMNDMFSPEDLNAMHRIRRALVPADGMNPYKVLPREGVTVDLVHPRRQVPQ